VSNELTEEQKAKIPLLVEKWTAIGMSTEPTDRKRAEEGVRLAYEQANLAQPKDIFWFESPMAAKEELERRGLPTDAPIHGQHDADLYGYFEFFEDIPELADDLAKVQGCKMVAESAGWWWAFDEAAFMSDRPIAIHLDDQNRLHNEDGLAMEFADGRGVASVRGVYIRNSQYVTDKSLLNSTVIMAEQNVEVRRIYCELYGWDKFFREMDAELLDDDTDPLGHSRKLWRMELPGEPEPIVMVEVTNSTPEPDGTFKVYTLRVDPSHTNALDAQASLFMLTGEEYANALQLET
jgi:hypothetical protein